MVELAIVLPVMMILFLGSWTAADLIGANDTAIQATRAGARYGAELGTSLPAGQSPTASCNTTSNPDTCQVDEDIIDQMLPIVTGNLPNAVVNQIDIYEPSGDNCGTFVSGSCPPNNGAYTSATSPPEPINVYTINGTTITPPTNYTACSASSGLDCYTLSERTQTHPDESELGVRILFTYTSPTLSMFSQQDSQYTVIRLAPQE
jgi:hypothetical protein